MQLCSYIHTYTYTLYIQGLVYTHQGFLKGPIGQWMTYLDHATYYTYIHTCYSV